MLLVWISSCTPPKNKLPDLKETFAYNDNRPFGASVAYGMLQNAYPNEDIVFNKQEFGDNYGWFYDTASVYFNVSHHYYVNDRDAQALLDFVYKGNTAILSSADFDTVLFNKIYCKQTYNEGYNQARYWKETGTRFTKDLSLYNEKFNYYFTPFTNSFPSLNSDYARILGYNDENNTNMFVFLWGNGKFIFHAEPRAFSNYFLLTNNNHLYLQELLQTLPVNIQNIYWDNYYAKKNYAKRNNDSGGSLSTLMKYPPLANAFFICLALLAFYILFNSKRRQRMIPIVKPTDNTTVAFAEAIAGLYLSKKDNKVIAEKMITYFNEHIRTKYFFTSSLQDESFADVLSRKSGVPYDITNKLANEMRIANSNVKISDEQLLVLNSLIEKFLKNKA
jgi:hypothetical protein